MYSVQNLRDLNVVELTKSSLEVLGLSQKNWVYIVGIKIKQKILQDLLLLYKLHFCGKDKITVNKKIDSDINSY